MPPNKIAVRLATFLWFFGAIALLVAVGVLSTEFGNSNYAADLYQAVPWGFWITLWIAGGCGIGIIVLEAVTKREGHHWIWGFLLIAAATTTLLLQPLLRDYAFHGQYDTIVHYSWTLEIDQYGSLAIDDFYPLAHLWASLLAAASGMTVQRAILVLPAIMYIVGACTAFLLSWATDDRPEVQGLITVMLVLPIFSFFQSMFYPLQMGVYFFWLFLAFFIKTRGPSRSIQETLIFVLILFSVPFIHPLAVLAALASIASYFMFSAFQGEQRGRGKQGVERFSVPFLMLFASWFTWFSSFRAFGISVSRIFQALTEELSGQAIANRYSGVVEGASSLEEVSRLAIFVHGPALIYVALGGIATLLLLRSRVRTRTVFLIFNIGAFVAVGLLSLAIDLIAETPQRYFNYAVAAVPAFAVPIFMDHARNLNRHRKSILAAGLAILLTASFWLGTRNLFFSSLVRETNHQFSFAQLSGFEFLVSYVDGDAGNIYSPLRGTQGIFALGPYNDVLRSFRSTPSWRMAFAPAHFGYQDSDEDFVDPAYLVLTEFERNLFRQGPQTNLFSPVDFLLLERDERWNKVYDSGDFELRAWRELENP